jgi:mannose/cellobiose epimerase-like protein (N-acyl-D-glucosamine 2-epimerase family)
MSASCPHLATMKLSRRDLAALLPAFMTSAAFCQSSASHTEASRDEIHKHIDRQWFLNSLLHDNLEHWLTAAATPSGFFQANLDRQWRPMGDVREATLLTQGRLLYNMAVGYEFSRNDLFLNALNKGADFLISNMHDTKYGGYFTRVAPDGKVLDDSKQSYGMSFVIFALVRFFTWEA